MTMNAPILLAACLCATLSSAAGAAERRIDLSSFDALRVEGPFVVHLTSAPSPRGTMHGDPVALRQTEATINGRTLVIRTLRDGTARRATDGPVELTIAAPPLSGITMVGGGLVTAQALRGDMINVAINGAGEVRIDRADGERLATMLLGPAKLSIAGGRVGKARFAASGQGVTAATGLDAGEVTVTLDGPGDTSVRARYTATITNRGLGRITVDGTPRCRILQQGSGPIRCGARQP